MMMIRQFVRLFATAAVAGFVFMAWSPQGAAAQEGTLNGQVVDAGTRAPVNAAQVHIPALNIGTMSRQDGAYTVANVPAGTHEVRVSRLGYRTVTQEVTIGAGETVDHTFELVPAALALDAIVVTGTAGQARRREVGNTITQLDMSDVMEPVRSVDAIIQGRVPGAQISLASSAPGAGSAIRLRGNVSVAMSNQPIIFIDGVRTRSDMYPINRSEGQHWIMSASDTPSPLNDLNPNDIERIEIIKGSAATTLYGTEAAAGVIQIFTKRGTEGPPTWTAQVNQRFDRVRPFGSSANPYVNMGPFLGTGSHQDYSLSVSGGGAGLRYYLSGRVQDGTGVLPNDRETRQSVRGNFSFEPLEGLNLEWSTQYGNHEFRQTPTGQCSQCITYNAMRAPFSPMADRLEDTFLYLIDNDNERFSTSMTAAYQPRHWFTHRLSVGYDRSSAQMTQEMPFGHPQATDGLLTDRYWTSETLSLDYVGSADWQVSSDFRTQFSWGGQTVEDRERDLQARGTGLPGPGVHTISSASERQAWQSRLRVINAGVFAQTLFDFRDRYFVTVGLRVDGNSAFGENLGLQTYPKVSASYVVSDEEFWPEVMGEMKLRAAYGHSGRAPGAFDAVRTWNALPFGGISAFWPGNLGNPDIGPERTVEVEFGFDASFLEGRVGLDVTRYQQTTRDALFNVSQVPSQGFTGAQLTNVGEITNEGFEISVRTTPLQRPSLTWDLGVNVSTNKSETVTLGDAPPFSVFRGGQGWVWEGQPVPVVRGRKVVNADERAEPIIELDHFFGPNYPTHTIQLNSQVSLPRGISVSAVGEYQGGHYMQDEASSVMANRGAGAVGAPCQEAYGHVPFEGFSNDHPSIDQLTALQRARCYTVNSHSQLWIYPADHFRMRELTVSAPIPNFPGANSARLSLSARNFWTRKNSDFWAFDPEMGGWDGGSVTTRFIQETVPAPASYTLSVQVVF
jgi:TonB-dependent starch-binding outer membrane protein SusC